jgi:hypothetical protein
MTKAIANHPFLYTILVVIDYMAFYGFIKKDLRGFENIEGLVQSCAEMLGRKKCVNTL